MLMLCPGPDLLTFVVMLAAMLAPVVLVIALAASVIIRMKAAPRHDRLKLTGGDTGR